MPQIPLRGGTLDCQVDGRGEPVVFIHGSFLADSFAPLRREPELVERFTLLSYHRRGFGRSSRRGTAGIRDDAEDCAAVIASLGNSSAHVVAHSYACLIALELALIEPTRAHTLAFLEPAFPPSMLPPGDPGIAAQRFRARKMYVGGDIAGAVDLSLALALGTDYRNAIDAHLPPDAFAQAIADAPTYFDVEERLAGEWSLSPLDAATISQPVLSVVGRDSDGRFQAAHQMLLRWFPWTETVSVPDTTHLMHMMRPAPIAMALAAFFERHPMA